MRRCQRRKSLDQILTQPVKPTTYLVIVVESLKGRLESDLIYRPLSNINQEDMHQARRHQLCHLCPVSYYILYIYINKQYNIIYITFTTPTITTKDAQSVKPPIYLPMLVPHLSLWNQKNPRCQAAAFNSYRPALSFQMCVVYRSACGPTGRQQQKFPGPSVILNLPTISNFPKRAEEKLSQLVANT